MKNPWATFSFSYGLKAVISRRGSQTHKSLQHIADWTILLNQPFKVRKSSRLKVDNDLTFMCNFTLVAHSCIFVYWKDCSTLFHQTSPLPQSHSYLSASTLGITQLNCCTVYTYIHREIVCAYVYMALHTHIYIVYFDCCSLYLPDVIFWKAGGGVGWESHGTHSFTAVSWGKGRWGAIVGSYKNPSKKTYNVFGHCFFLLAFWKEYKL